MDTGQVSAAIQKYTDLGELYDPIYNISTMILTIIVAGWDVGLLVDNFQFSRLILINSIKSYKFHKIALDL